MKKVLLLAAAAFALSGCAYLRAVSFNPDDSSGVAGAQTTSLYLIPRKSGAAAVPKAKAFQVNHVTGAAFEPEEEGTTPTSPAEPPTAEAKAKAFRDAVGMCRPAGSGPGPLGVGGVLIGFLVEQGIAMFTDALSARIEEIQQRSQRTYSASVVLDGREQYNDAACIVVIRGTAAKDSNGLPKKIGLAMVLELTRVGGDAVAVQPIFIHMENAIAITGDGEPVDVAVAVAAKAARVKDNIRRVDAFAQTSFSVPGVPLGGMVEDLPDPSGLVALTPTDASAVELSVAITESGTGLPDTEKAKAELKALAEALGPEIVAKAKALAGD